MAPARRTVGPWLGTMVVAVLLAVLLTLGRAARVGEAPVPPPDAPEVITAADRFLNRIDRHLTGQVFRQRSALEALRHDFQTLRADVGSARLDQESRRRLEAFAANLDQAFGVAMERLEALEAAGDWSTLAAFKARLARLRRRVDALRVALTVEAQ